MRKRYPASGGSSENQPNSNHLEVVSAVQMQNLRRVFWKAESWRPPARKTRESRTLLQNWWRCLISSHIHYLIRSMIEKERVHVHGVRIFFALAGSSSSLCLEKFWQARKKFTPDRLPSRSPKPSVLLFFLPPSLVRIPLFSISQTPIRISTQQQSSFSVHSRKGLQPCVSLPTVFLSSF